MSVCSVEGCDRAVRHAGLCGAHYHRNRRNGSPTAGGRARRKVSNEEMKTTMEQALALRAGGSTLSEIEAELSLRHFILYNWMTVPPPGAEDLCAWFKAEWQKSKKRIGRLRKPSERTGFTYFIAPVGGGCVKIGFTENDVAWRLRALQIGSPVRLEVAGFVRGPIFFERWFHTALKADRSHGEWFHPTSRVMATIALAVATGDLDSASEERRAAIRAAAGASTDWTAATPYRHKAHRQAALEAVP